MSATSTDASEPIARTWLSQGLTLNYLDWGNDNAPLLILIHGNGDHARTWDWTARALRDRFHIIAADLRGHGDSAWSPDGAYSSPYHVQDIADLIETLGHERMILAGHSFGSAVAMRYAAMYPDRVDKLVVVDGLGPAPHVLAKWAKVGVVARARTWIEKRREAASRPQRRFASIEEAAARLQRDNARLSGARARHLALHGLRRQEDGFAWKRDPLASVFGPEDFLLEEPAVWRAITAPTLFFYAPESWMANPLESGLNAHFQDSRTVVIQEAGHWLHHDQFDAFIAALKEFL